MTLTSLRCVACRSRKREHLQTLQVRLGYLEKENARLTQKLSQQDAELDKFRQGLPSHHPGTQSSHFSFLSIRLAFRFISLTLVSDQSLPTAAGLPSKSYVWLLLKVSMALTYVLETSMHVAWLRSTLCSCFLDHRLNAATCMLSPCGPFTEHDSYTTS